MDEHEVPVGPEAKPKVLNRAEDHMYRSAADRGEWRVPESTKQPSFVDDVLQSLERDIETLKTELVKAHREDPKINLPELTAKLTDLENTYQALRVSIESGSDRRSAA